MSDKVREARTMREDLIEAISAVQENLWIQFDSCRKRSIVVDAIMPVIANWIGRVVVSQPPPANVEASKFKVGDSVRVVKHRPRPESPTYKADREKRLPVGTIKTIRGFDFYGIERRLLVEDNGGWILYEDEVELAPSLPDVPATKDAPMWDAIYDVLIGFAGAADEEPAFLSFMAVHATDSPCEEYRFMGSLGMGGKFRSKSWTVDCYREDENDERRETIRKTNRALARLLAALRTAREEGASGSLSFSQFQAVNVKRCGEAFKHELGDWSLLEWAGAMCGEAGETANVCKKIKRQMQGHGGDWAKRRDPTADELHGKLADEIGDTVAYLALLAAAAGLDLGECAAKKFDQISDEAGWNGPRIRATALRSARGCK